MYPSFTGNYIQPSKYNNVANLLKTTQEHYYPPFSSPFQPLSPHYITLEDGNIFSELLRQEDLFSYNHSNHNHNHNTNSTNVVHEQFSSHNIRASQHSNEGKCSNNNGESDVANKPENSNARRASKKNDRHSKINTAQGLRDRRMRLSLDVARKFFKLQDILGFDKASETVDWLLTKSKSSIQELLHHQRSNFSGVSNSASKWELISENIEDDDQKAKSSSSSNRKERKKATRLVRKGAYLLRPCAKETREMARKRARERTMEKSSKLGCVSGGDDQISKSNTCLDQEIDQDSNPLGSWINNQPELPSSQFQFNQGLVCDNSLSNKGNWNPSFLFNYQHDGVLPHEHDQLNAFHMLANSWEG